MTSPRIAVVGTTRAGKSVFITALAKHLETQREGARLAPREGSPKNTYAQIEEWWNELQGGNWLPPTPPGSLIELNWDLAIEGQKIPLQMFDYAGETLTDLFSNRTRNAEGAAKEYFEKVRKAFEGASILLVLLNLESLVEQGVDRALETKSTLITAIAAFLEKIKADKRECRVCFIFTAYDRYQAVIKQRWGTVESFLQREIPPLYYEAVDNSSNVRIVAVAAVSETETRVESQTGRAMLYPKSGFQPKGLSTVVRWLVQAATDSKAELDAKAMEVAQDQHNQQWFDRLLKEWDGVQASKEPQAIERFLEKVKQPFPFPNRRNVPGLSSRLEPVVTAATKIQTGLVKAALEAKTASRRKAFWNVAMVIGLTCVGGCGVVAWLDSPTLVSWEYACKPNWWGGCKEHRGVAEVAVWNIGEEGIIEVTVTVGNRSQSTKRHFRQYERARVTVVLEHLPSHDIPGNQISCTMRRVP